MKQSFSIKAFQFAAAAIVSLGAAAVRAEDYSTWMQQSINGYGYSAEIWADPADPDAPLAVATAGKSYYTPSGRTFTLPKENGKTLAFPGSSLAVAGTLNVGTYGNTYNFNELRLLAGGNISYSTHGSFSGKIVIEGTAEKPAKISPFNYGKNRFAFPAFSCADDQAVVNFACTGGSNGSTKKPDHQSAIDCPLRLEGSWADYPGTAILSTNGCFYLDASAQEFPGRLIIKGGVLYNSKNTGTCQVGSLDLRSGSELYVLIKSTTTGECAVYNVTNEFLVGESLTVTLSSAPLVNAVTLIKLSGRAAENPPDVSGVAVNSPWKGPAQAHLEVVDNGDGTKDVRLVNDIAVFMTHSNGSYKAEDSAFYASNASWWSTGVIPDSTFDGVVYCGGNWLMWVPDWSDHAYPDMTIVASVSLRPHVQSLTLKGVYTTAAEGGYLTIASYSGAPTTTLYAPVHMVSGDIFLSGRGNHTTVMADVIDGVGGVLMNTDTDGQRFNVRLLAENTFGGVVKVNSYASAKTYDPSTGTDTATCLTIGKAANLGGAYVGTTPWKAFEVNNYSKVILTDSATLDDATRGLYVNAGARFEVPAGKTLAIDYPITFGGEMMKLGAGRLELGGTVQFYDAATKAPVADPPAFDPTATLSNLLTVAAGSLKVTSAAAVDGVQVAFAEGTTLVVDTAATGDLRTFGAKNVKWETPFVSSAEDGKIAVAFEGTLAGESATVAVCTISATATAPTFALPRRYGHHKVVASGWKTNADGTRTFEVTLEHQGLLLLVK